MTTSLENELANALKANGFDLSAAQQAQLIAYLNLLAQWNQAFNLTAIRDQSEMIPLHLLDSLAIAPYLHGDTIIDIGTGAGLPGIPLAILFPTKKFTLLDSNSKKTRFLTQVKLALKIPNIEILHSRCEDFQPEVGFDSVVSRAFAAIPVMLAQTKHLVAPDGQFIAMKGVYPTAEVASLPTDVSVLGIHKLVINGLPAERHVVCLQIIRG